MCFAAISGFRSSFSALFLSLRKHRRRFKFNDIAL